MLYNFYVDCGDHSCLFAKDKSGRRTNGGCRCLGISSLSSLKHQARLRYVIQERMQRLRELEAHLQEATEVAFKAGYARGYDFVDPNHNDGSVERFEQRKKEMEADCDKEWESYRESLGNVYMNEAICPRCGSNLLVYATGYVSYDEYVFTSVDFDIDTDNMRCSSCSWHGGLEECEIAAEIANKEKKEKEAEKIRQDKYDAIHPRLFEI